MITPAFSQPGPELHEMNLQLKLKNGLFFVLEVLARTLTLSILNVLNINKREFWWWWCSGSSFFLVRENTILLSFYILPIICFVFPLRRCKGFLVSSTVIRLNMVCYLPTNPDKKRFLGIIIEIYQCSNHWIIIKDANIILAGDYSFRTYTKFTKKVKIFYYLIEKDTPCFFSSGRRKCNLFGKFSLRTTFAIP